MTTLGDVLSGAQMDPLSCLLEVSCTYIKGFYFGRRLHNYKVSNVLAKIQSPRNFCKRCGAFPALLLSAKLCAKHIDGNRKHDGLFFLHKWNLMQIATQARATGILRHGHSFDILLRSPNFSFTVIIKADVQYFFKTGPGDLSLWV